AATLGLDVKHCSAVVTQPLKQRVPMIELLAPAIQRGETRLIELERSGALARKSIPDTGEAARDARAHDDRLALDIVECVAGQAGGAQSGQSPFDSVGNDFQAEDVAVDAREALLIKLLALRCF